MNALCCRTMRVVSPTSGTSGWAALPCSRRWLMPGSTSLWTSTPSNSSTLVARSVLPFQQKGSGGSVPRFNFSTRNSVAFSDGYLQDPLTEHAIYEQMALISTVCAFSWSRWNSRSGNEHLVIQVFYLIDSKLQLVKLQIFRNVRCISSSRRVSTTAPAPCPRTRGRSTCWPLRRSWSWA